jgi:hypothetical protein
MAEVGEAEKMIMRMKLKSIGCAFAIHLPDVPADPERTILESLKYWWSYNDFFFMCYSLLKKGELRDLVNVERLIALVENEPLKNDELVLLLGLSQRMVDIGDDRFIQLKEKLDKPGLKMESAPEGEADPYLIVRWGIETSLENYGVRVRSFYEEHDGKFYTLKGVLENNEWLRIRSKIGANFKADIAYFKISGKARTAEEAQALTGCSALEAKQHWKDLKDINSIDNLVA